MRGKARMAGSDDFGARKKLVNDDYTPRMALAASEFDLFVSGTEDAANMAQTGRRAVGRLEESGKPPTSGGEKALTRETAFVPIGSTSRSSQNPVRYWCIKIS